MADFNHIRTIRHPAVLEYCLTLWGELIYGTKEQLQAMGIGIGAQFPATDRERLKLTDPRGLPAEILYTPFKGEGIYGALIHYPGREHPGAEWEHHVTGVKVREHVGSNEYLGSADALVAAGLVRLEHMPGQPGMGKVQVTIHPDGTPKAPHDKHAPSRQAGATTIKRISKSSYLVRVDIPKAERDLRDAAYTRRMDAWERKMAALPRPQPLRPLAAGEVLSRQLGHARKDGKFQAFLGGLTQ